MKILPLSRVIFLTLIAVVMTWLLQTSNLLHKLVRQHTVHETSTSSSNSVNQNFRFARLPLDTLHHRVSKEELQSVYTALLNWSHISNNSQKDPLLNRHQFSYSLNSDTCPKYSPHVIIFVQSATDHFDQRVLIRSTWAGVNIVRNVTFRTVFMLGETKNRAIQQRIETEHSTFGDIVQGNFMDKYLNLPYKHIMSLGWIITYCPDVKLIVKVDDDTILNLYNLIDYIVKTGYKANNLFCSVFYHQGPVRKTYDKWYVNTSTYPFEKYPDYCEGFGYLMSPDVARSLYKASENTRFYWVDDVYVTGILALKVGLRLSCFVNRHSYIRRRKNLMDVTNAMFITPLDNWDLYWNSILQNASVS